MSEGGDTRETGQDLSEPAEEASAGREGRLRLLGARIACVVGVLFAVGGALATLTGGNPEISGGAVGVGLGIVGSLLGSRRLATLTVFFGVAAIFLALAASQGLIPGIEPLDRQMPG